MTVTTGTADLPLHGGRVPQWLAERMSRLGRVVVEALVLEEGTSGVLERLAHPHWFQALGCAMGMDWHSSGITTSVLGALKRGLAPVQDELGLWVCGGRGRQSRRTPEELRKVAERTGLDGERLVRASRLVAKVDNSAVQDGFQLYLHGFAVDRTGAWSVVQQGMPRDRRTASLTGDFARRYHWTCTHLRSFVDRPHAAIEGRPHPGPIVNLTHERSDQARDTCVQVFGQIRERGPEHWLELVRQARRAGPHLVMPERHEVRAEDVVPRRLLAAAALEDIDPPAGFEELLLTPGMGPRTLSSIAIIAELIFGHPSRFSDPARFSYAHGGKDGHPFPVPTRVYDRTLRVWQDALRKAKLGRDEKLSAIRRLDAERRRLEDAGPWAPPVGAPAGSRLLSADERRVEALFERERRRSPGYGGMTAHGPASRVPDSTPSRAAQAHHQLHLWADPD